MSGRLVVCPTPIGNLEDVTLRVLSALREADVVACEDTRRTRILLDRYGVRAKLVSYHEHNERARSAELVERMRGGAVRAGDLLLEPARAVVAAHALPPAREAVRIEPAHYGDEAGMMGAARMALELVEGRA